MIHRENLVEQIPAHLKIEVIKYKYVKIMIN